jgi:transcriptional regulator with XRE-family HTH domain
VLRLNKVDKYLNYAKTAVQDSLVKKLNEYKDPDITGRELSVRIGKSFTYLSHMANGQNYPNLETSFRIADALAVDYDDFLGETAGYYLLLESKSPIRNSLMQLLDNKKKPTKKPSVVDEYSANKIFAFLDKQLFNERDTLESKADSLKKLNTIMSIYKGEMGNLYDLHKNDAWYKKLHYYSINLGVPYKEMIANDNSLSGKGILKGSTILLEKCDYVKAPGAIYSCYINNKNVLRIIDEQNGFLFLKTTDNTQDVITIEPDKVTIEGIVIAVVTMLNSSF